MSFLTGQIASRFSKAALHYEQHASAQQQSAKLLLAQGGFSGRVLDLGCGTGRESLMLAELSAVDEVFAVDIAEGMLSELKKRAPFHVQPVQANALSLPFVNNAFDAIFSNFALQWVTHLPRLANELARVLHPDGVLRFSVPAPMSLQSLKAAGIYINEFADENVWVNALQAAGFKKIIVQHDQVVEYFERPEDLLSAMKAIGANTRDRNEQAGLRGKEWLKQVKHALEYSREPEGLPLKYHIFLISAQR